MANIQKVNGKCLCGSIKVTVEKMKGGFGACHCGMCRKWGGGPFMTVDCGMDVKFTGDEHITCFDSSNWAERGFCKKCGTHLFYRLKQNNIHMMPVGLFDDLSHLNFDRQVYIDHKPDYYNFSNKTKNMTEADIMALYFQSPEN